MYKEWLVAKNSMDNFEQNRKNTSCLKNKLKNPSKAHNIQLDTMILPIRILGQFA